LGKPARVEEASDDGNFPRFTRITRKIEDDGDDDEDEQEHDDEHERDTTINGYKRFGRW
jgi:hypothetical protein